ncbi:MAG TPA: response regulator [Gemmatimonadaceae bacterium]|nr:response regulator [Gemmatimonadaceae bacterium]
MSRRSASARISSPAAVEREPVVLSLTDARRRRAAQAAAPAVRAAEPQRRGVVIQFPARPAAAPSPAVARTTAPRQILVIDDSASSIMWQRLILKNAYDVHGASSANEGVSIAEMSLPDLLVIDRAMPGVSGLAACRALRASERTRHIPIVLLATSHELAAAREEAAMGLADVVVEKPVRREALLEAVATLLAR